MKQYLLERARDNGTLASIHDKLASMSLDFKSSKWSTERLLDASCDSPDLVMLAR